MLRALAAFAVVVAIAGAVLFWLTGREYDRPVDTVNPGGQRGRALVVFQPGLADFPDSVVRAFAAELAAAGWRVEIATVGPQAPTDVTRYGLLAVAAPVYWYAPAIPLTRWLARAGDLRGKPTVVLLTAAGSAGRALRLAEARVRAAHGQVVDARAVFTWRPNDEARYRTVSNRELAYERARDAARQALSRIAR